jgi:hypothetical protein
MSVDRLSVTVPSQLGAAMRTLARARGETVSTFVSDAISQRIRLAALDGALEAAAERHGAIPEAAIDEAEAQLRRALTKAKRAPRRRRR